jgi:L-threonylcarbamoyladenylate synthase
VGAGPAGERDRDGHDLQSLALSGPERVALAGLDAASVAALGRRVGAARLVCFPTDTVYGVGGALTPAVAEALVAAKGRSPGKPLQVIFPSLQQLESTVTLAPALRAACRALLPGPVTLVVPYPPGWRFPPAGHIVCRDREIATLGLRVPEWPPPARVLAALEMPLVASSANPSGAPAPASLDEVDPVLLACCDLALDAGPVYGASSSVVDLSVFAETGRWRLVREGVWDGPRIAARLAAARDGAWS